MIKYTDVDVTFAEIPDEINLCFSISNCAGMCRNCHSPELRDNIGKDLLSNIVAEVKQHKGISCVCFLGEARKVPHYLRKWNTIISVLRNAFPKMKVAIYSGRDEVEDEMWQMFDYIKVGPYIEERGPLENPNTNQKLFKIDRKNNQKIDITHLFWRKSQEDKNRIK